MKLKVWIRVLFRETAPCFTGTRCCPNIQHLPCQLYYFQLSVCCNIQTAVLWFQGLVVLYKYIK